MQHTEKKTVAREKVCTEIAGVPEFVTCTSMGTFLAMITAQDDAITNFLDWEEEEKRVVAYVSSRVTW